MVAFGEVGLYLEAEELLLSLHLEYGSVVVAAMVISTLPQVRSRFGHDFDCVTLDDVTLGLPCPLEIVDIQCHNLVVLFYVLLAFAIVIAAACRHQCHPCERNYKVFHLVTGIPLLVQPLKPESSSITS